MASFTHGFEELRADVVERWKAAWDRIGECAAELPAETRTAYSRHPAFSLEWYSGGKVKAGARLRNTPNKSGPCHRFDLDADGRPLRVRSEHPLKAVSWDGVYRYAPTEVEHIEWCLETGVPCLYDRVLLDNDGAVVAQQRFVTNSGGYRSEWCNAERTDVVETILGDDHSFFVFLWRYYDHDGQTLHGEECHPHSLGTDRATLEYTYAPDGELQRIVQHWPSAAGAL